MSQGQPDDIDTMLDESVRDGSLIESINEKGESVYSLSGKGLLDAKKLIREAGQQPDTCSCEALLVPDDGWRPALVKHDQHCVWHTETIKLALAGKSLDARDAWWITIFLWAADPKMCNWCGDKTAGKTPTGIKVCKRHLRSMLVKP